MSSFFRFLISRAFFINLFIILLLISGGLYAVFSYLDTYTKHGKIIEVPDLVGMNYGELDTLITQEVDFTIEISDSIFEKGLKGGTILEQNPLAATGVKQGRKIYITVAAYRPAKIIMPRLVDMSLRQATSLMEIYGLELGELTYIPDNCANCVLEQKINDRLVEEGEKIEKGSKIDLVIGQGLGNELTAVPYLLDFSANMAESFLKSKSLNLGVLIFDETVENKEDSLNARVYKQEPFYSEAPSVRMGTAIDLFLTLDTNKINHTFNPIDTL